MLTQEQIEMRRTMITATDAVAIAGESPSRSALDVYVEKIGLSEPWGGNTATRVGEHNEQLALTLLSEEQGLLLSPATTERHPSIAHLGATPDRNVIEPESKKRVAVAEAKFVGYRQIGRWGITPPDSVVIQVTQQMFVTQTTIAHVVALIGTEPRFYVVELDPGLADALVTMGDDFWKNHIIARRPPLPDASEAAGRALRQIYPRVRGDMFKASPEIEEMAKEYFAAERAEKEAKTKKLAAENLLKSAIADSSGVEGDGWTARWTERKGSVSWKEAFNALVKRVGFGVETEAFRNEGTRVFNCEPRR